jgi:hypothetical protein
MVGNEPNSTGDTMQRSFKLAQAGEPSLDHWGFAVQTAMALIVVVLFTLTFAALEVFLSGDESLIPSSTDQNPWAHWRNPMDMMRQG